VVRTELYTSGGEFALPNGTMYIGAYHIHDTEGPMVGAFHKSTPHEKLTALTSRSQAFVDNVTQQLKNQSTPPSSSVGSSGGSGSSGGGGY
tara:strand:+ start:1277 stop:1549 length:273 start_codon:yes stop_codon:yes gene_type:complete